MTDHDVDSAIRQAIGGDVSAIAWIVGNAAATPEPVVIVMAALLQRNPLELERAAAIASTRRDRQVVEIARAHMSGASDLVDALARDHLVDHPDSLIVAWIASGAKVRGRPEAPI